ncbi:hypothetical protein [Nocardioides sp. TF02-7]|uniref:maltokinase N-terminal cap-like domain-containing protein n=1 Tax=Nocardioides sp. TF02-7 TaxID=2917724 RepID=UPI001F052177|nr:hypothetical protein [Nocardioides sp. TF02-7]UMG92989.1 hypothetical protein MF408_01115 [Nocardioides sp. TF02-7]
MSEDARGRDGHLREFIADARWFGGKGREFDVGDVRRLGLVGDPAGDPVVVVDLVTVVYDDASEELYQVPLALYTDPEGRLDHAFVGWWEEPDLGWRHAYDALHDRTAMARFVEAFADPALAEGVEFVRIGDHELEPDAHSTVFSGEQSNSTVLYGEDSVLKVFRRLTPGENPDITTHKVLTEAGSTHVAHLYGWIEHKDLHLAMLQQFLRTASDGWELALASVRDLFSEADLHADEVGGDFAAESARLGVALAEVHEQMRASFGTSAAGAASVADGMNERLDAAIEVVPQLAEHADRLRGAFAALAGLGDLPVHRIHGDLHLGQTLRTVAGWKVVDFEGEPAKPLAERLLPDSPWRDVAGMLRSFDYAPHAIASSLPEDDPDVAGQRERRAQEWAARNKEAFLRAYAGDRDLTRDEGVLVAAYVADKAIYECVYEARNRPTWLVIPLTAIARIGTP